MSGAENQHVQDTGLSLPDTCKTQDHDPNVLNTAGVTTKQRFKLSHDAQCLIDVCITLGIKITEEDIKLWLSPAYRKVCRNIKEEVAARTGSDFIGVLVSNLLVWDPRLQADKNNSKYIQFLHQQLTSNLVGRVNSKVREGVGCLDTSKNYQTRRTRMNTTMERSASLDRPVLRYLDEQNLAEPLTVVDLGVGYPPLLTHETARKVGKRAHVIGIDITTPDVCVEFPSYRSFPYLVFYNVDPHSKSFIPVYAMRKESPKYDMIIYTHLDGDEARYAMLKSDELRKQLMSQVGEEAYINISLALHNPAETFAAQTKYDFRRFLRVSDISRGKNKLIFQPMRRLNTRYDNLEFRQDDFRLQTISEADIVRVANVLRSEYYTQDEAVDALKLMTPKVKPRGILIIGIDESLTFVYRRLGDRLMPIRGTVMLKHNEPLARAGIEFPGFEGLIRAIQEEQYVVDEKHRKPCRQMSDLAAKDMKDALDKRGYNTSYSVLTSHTWLDFDLKAKGI